MFIDQDGNIIKSINNYYVDNSSRYLKIYFYSYLASNASRNITIHIKSKVSSLRFDNNCSFLCIDNNDIEYWQLLSYFNEYRYYVKSMEYESSVESKLDDILTAINNIHINVTEQDIDNITNNFDNDITTIHNVEVNFDNSFGNYDGSISDNDITLNLTPYSPTFSLIKSNVTSLWSSDLIKIPITLSCLVFIFLVILG